MHIKDVMDVAYCAYYYYDGAVCHACGEQKNPLARYKHTVITRGGLPRVVMGEHYEMDLGGKREGGREELYRNTTRDDE